MTEPQQIFIKRSIEKDGLPKKNGYYSTYSKMCPDPISYAFKDGEWVTQSAYSFDRVIAWLEPIETPMVVMTEEDLKEDMVELINFMRNKLGHRSFDGINANYLEEFEKHILDQLPK